jgi:UDP-2-acetamido-2,6-beta-L-arabino-hexul-4-ose reductase
MKILITGAKGFIGKNLIAELENIRDGKRNNLPSSFPKTIEIYPYDVDTDPQCLEDYCAKADFIFHLAGVNRPQHVSEYMEGNFGFTSLLLNTLKKYNNRAPIVLSSSIQAELDNPYGLSKKAGEELLFSYAREMNSSVLIYRFPNVFGKWCRPNYNSVVATFCHNIARNLPIQINDPKARLNLVYIDDVVEELIVTLVGQEHKEGEYCMVPTVHSVLLGDIAEMLHSFKEFRSSLQVPDLSDAFTKKLYSTYLSYLPADAFSYPLKMNVDHRGSFTEFLKSGDRGQVSVNISKPHITKGEHWHHTKNEKFLVVSGRGVIRFRKIGEEQVYEYFVSGDKLEVVDIPVGYTHNIENLGDTDMVTIMWVNEVFDPESPDTYFEKIKE